VVAHLLLVIIMPAFPNEIAPALSLPSINRDAFALKDSKPELFTVIVFHRGAHCPICKSHVKEIEEHCQKALDAGTKIVAVSMDTKERADLFHKEVADALNQEKLQVPILYGLTEHQASEWGLYFSEKRPDTSEPDVFSEPGVFVIRPDNSIFMMQMQSAPFARPSMDQLIEGLQRASEHNCPVRGTHKKGEKTNPLSDTVPELACVKDQ